MAPAVDGDRGDRHPVGLRAHGLRRRAPDPDHHLGLPILVGLGVDFSIQTHNRFEEELRLDGSPDGAVRRVFARLGPPLTVAMLAAVKGFLSLEISDVQQIRQFGIMLALGIAALFVAATLVPSAVLVLRERRSPAPPASCRGDARAGGPLGCARVAAPSRPGGRGGARDHRRRARRRGTLHHPDDAEKWVAQDSTTVRELRRLREVTAYSSELVVLVEAPDVTTTEVLQWTQRFAEAQVARHPDVLVRGASMAGVSSPTSPAHRRARTRRCSCWTAPSTTRPATTSHRPTSCARS